MIAPFFDLNDYKSILRKEQGGSKLMPPPFILCLFQPLNADPQRSPSIQTLKENPQRR